MTYDPANPRVYFDLGSAVATVAILLAFEAMASPLTRLRLRIRGFDGAHPALVFLVGVCFVILSALVPMVPGESVLWFGYPLFWEVLAAVFFTGGAAALWTFGHRSVVFKKTNAVRYGKTAFQIIADGDEGELAALARELQFSAEPIVSAAAMYKVTEESFARLRGQEYSVPDHTQLVLELLDLLSDRRLCTAIVNKAPATALAFFHEINRQHLYDSGGRLFVDQMIRQAFLSPSSILHREEPYYGLGIYQPFTLTVFGDYDFVSSGFRPLQAWSPRVNEPPPPDVLDRYVRALKTAFGAYLRSGQLGESADAISCGIKTLVSCASAYVSPTRDAGLAQPMDLDTHGALSDVCRCFVDLVRLLEQKQTYLVKQQSHPAEKWDTLGDGSPYELLAEGIAKFLCVLATDRSHDESYRQIVLSLLTELPGRSQCGASPTGTKVQKRLLDHLEPVINRNLTQKRVAYPMVLRLLLNAVGLASGHDRPDGLQAWEDLVHSAVKAGFRKAIALTENREEELLPEGMINDRSVSCILDTRFDDTAKYCLKYD